MGCPLMRRMETTMMHATRRLLLAGVAAAFAGSLAPMAIAADGVTFTVTIRNVSTDTSLKLPDGRTMGVPVAPGVYAVSATANVLFTPGGFADEALERLAEDGNYQPILDKVTATKGLAAAGMFIPGQSFTVTARPGERLLFAAMFVQSNDLFYAPTNGGMSLFDSNGKPVRGKLTGRVGLYDAGTEVNQRPGIGADQAPRQPKPNTGASERVPINLVANRHDGFTYPPVESVIEIEVMPASGGT